MEHTPKGVPSRVFADFYSVGVQFLQPLHLVESEGFNDPLKMGGFRGLKPWNRSDLSVTCIRFVIQAGRRSLELATVPDGSRSRYEVSGKQEARMLPVIILAKAATNVNAKVAFRPVFMRVRATS
jgi:hypothetical protein